MSVELSNLGRFPGGRVLVQPSALFTRQAGFLMLRTISLYPCEDLLFLHPVGFSFLVRTHQDVNMMTLD